MGWFEGPINTDSSTTDCFGASIFRASCKMLHMEGHRNTTWMLCSSMHGVYAEGGSNCFIIPAVYPPLERSILQPVFPYNTSICMTRLELFQTLSCRMEQSAEGIFISKQKEQLDGLEVVRRSSCSSEEKNFILYEAQMGDACM